MSLNSDQPKDKKKQDALGFADSANSMAKTILDGNYPKGFVIGIDGDWGSGKTSFINFVRESLEEQSSEELPKKLKVIEFNPWLHSSHENLIAAYFKILQENSEDVFGDDKNIRETLGNIIDAFSPVGEIIANAISLGFLGKAVSKIMRLFSKELQKKPTLESQYKKIKEKLEEMEEPFLVIIDDIDRLDKTEIKTMLKLVKSVGQLPYVIYILAYDRDYVENATKDDMPDRKTTFLQKIIQVTFPIPKPDKNKLLEMLKKETTEFLKNIDKNDSRWYELDVAAIHPYIKKPRDVVLLANAINFSFHAMNKFLDPVDFRALESLRLFDKKLWDWIRDNENIVLVVGDSYALLDQDIDSFRNAIEKSLGMKLEDLSRNQKTTLSVLFPNLAIALDGSEFGVTEADHGPHNRYGVSMPNVYDSYFSKDFDKEAVSKDDIARFLENTADKEKLTKELLHWIGESNDYANPRITEFLRKLSYRFMDENSRNPDRMLLCVLADSFKYTKSLQESSLSYGTSPYRQLELVFRVLFEKIGKQETSEFLKTLCNDKAQLEAAVYLLFYIGYYIGKTYSNEKHSEVIDLMNDDDWDSLLHIISPHLEDAFLTGEVGNFAHVISANLLVPLIFGTSPARSMINKACERSEPYLIKSIKWHLGHTPLTDGSISTFKELKYPELFDFNFIAERAEKIDLEMHDEETKNAVKIFIKGVRTPELLTDNKKDT